jgi:transcriptional regulator with XRE-family HTH domain
MARQRDASSLEMSRIVQREFGTRLSAARKAKGMMQKTLAHSMGLTRTSVSNIERGIRRVSLDQVFQAAHILGIETNILLPSVSTVFEPLTIQSVVDDPLPPRAAAEASSVVRDLTAQMGRRTVSVGSRHRGGPSRRKA